MIEISTSLVLSILGWLGLIGVNIMLIGMIIDTIKKNEDKAWIVMAGILLAVVWIFALSILKVIVWVN